MHPRLQSTTELHNSMCMPLPISAAQYYALTLSYTNMGYRINHLGGQQDGGYDAMETH